MPRTSRGQGIRWVIILAGVAFAVHLIIPQVGELERSTSTLRGGSWSPTPATALGIIGSVTQRLPFGQTPSPSSQAAPPSHPTRAAQLVSAAVLVNVACIAALPASMAAFGPAPDPAHTSFAYLVAAVVGTVTPTPGGVGGFEAALVAGLTRIGPTAGQAVAATLAFRILTFWLPIIPGAVALRWLRKRRII